MTLDKQERDISKYKRKLVYMWDDDSKRKWREKILDAGIGAKRCDLITNADMILVIVISLGQDF